MCLKERLEKKKGWSPLRLRATEVNSRKLKSSLEACRGRLLDFKCLFIFLIVVLYRIVFYFLWKEMEKVTQEKNKTFSGRDKKLIYSVWKQYKKN